MDLTKVDRQGSKVSDKFAGFYHLLTKSSDYIYREMFRKLHLIPSLKIKV